MASQLTEDQLSDLKESFSLFDKDRDGTISSKDLGEVLRAIGKTPTEEQLKQMIQQVDDNHSGSIEINEFIKLMSRRTSQQDVEQEVRDAFAVFDQDSNGYISADEVKTVMASLGEKLSDAEVNLMITQADLDGDGRINIDEFIKMMMEK
ncbi:calmodulin [Auriculariales sp. MPI-PUGE-AT-0066]|nr:calmodulin [Auriculariales sp. MPI-PUGE-AT-0066]